MPDTSPVLPLQSLKILDFSTLLPGPYGSMLLADLGANVLHIESPNRPDLARVTPPFVGKITALHAYINRNKKSVTLDLKQPDAVKTVKQLIMEYDIIIEQFRPGVMTRLGLDYEQLKIVNPQLIYCSITGYGQSSPYQQRAGHDINYLALTGIADASRRKDQPPTPASVQIADVAGGSLHSVIGILAAVVARQTTGLGQHIDISMADCAFALNALAGSGFLGAGIEPKPEQQILNGGSFYDYYQTRDGRYLALGCLEPKFLQSFCQLIDKPELMTLANNPQPAAQQQMKAILTGLFLTEDLAYWQQRFATEDVCIDPVLTVAEACEHPHFKSRQMVVEVDTNEGKQRQMACPIKFSNAKAHYQHIGRTLGADNQWLTDKLNSSIHE
ncbi:CoA transferase [Endozoicomonas sp. SM1973]|uniref:CoA transferase n=1 Tax=Spartinivicinus marinus TaxID=2994442 RepID=A0A853HTN2_9GAMM|nr:CaiB/BaiF CoA-transferase family protein [Spartinivicinus marinus]MCX4029546.1 CaiB/BaiF CoA-transferase family protein [Spartinivicinus marinus]NYZ65120.1 CoA transferase [Spartinivicinus marinus]